MSSDLILITGASGHVGFRTLAIALERGHRVRVALRSEKRFDAIKSSLKEHYPELDRSKVDYVEVPELTAEGAYDNAVKGVSGVIHIASPITTGGVTQPDEFQKYFIEPAVKGTIGMLESAKKSGTVQRVVITSSVVAIVPFADFAIQPTDKAYNDDSQIPVDQAPYEFGEFQAYSASKAAAYNETLAWIEKERPSFDVVNLNPSFIEGRDDLQSTAAGSITGTNALIHSLALGQQWDAPKPGSSVHNEDVARVHVDALKPSIPAGTYVLNSRPENSQHGSDWANVPKLIEKLFPEAVKAGKIKPQEGKASSTPVKIDGSKAERTFGFKYLGLEQQVKSVIGQYLELLEKESGA